MKNRMMLLVGLMLCFSRSTNASEISLRVVDEKGTPIAGAEVVIAFAAPQQKDSKGNYGNTDRDGRFSAKGTNRVGVIVKVTKGSYYKWVREKGFGQKDHDITVVMRKVEKPVPLYVRRVNLKFLVFDEWLGFDFEAGDWVAPQGRGKSRDILFKFHREFKGYKFSEKKMEEMKFPDTTEADLKKFYGKWDGVLQVGFPSDLGGIVEEKENYLPYSEMKMPHLAPEEGYQSEEIVIEKRSYLTEEDERRSLEQMRDYYKSGIPESKPSGFFIRTRVVEVNGKVIKANYVKIPKYEDDMGGIVPLSVGASGTVSFTYYFNPTPNDRNLEYRPGLNLASEQKREYEP